MKRNDPGMTLATGMAISGAVANPHAGAGGSGWTEKSVRIVDDELYLICGSVIGRRTRIRIIGPVVRYPTSFGLGFGLCLSFGD